MVLGYHWLSCFVQDESGRGSSWSWLVSAVGILLDCWTYLVVLPNMHNKNVRNGTSGLDGSRSASLFAGASEPRSELGILEVCLRIPTLNASTEESIFLPLCSVTMVL